MEEQPTKRKKTGRKPKMSKPKTIILTIIYIILIIVTLKFMPFIWGLAGFHFEYSDGHRVGQVIKLSNKGIIYKTWEGALGLTQSGAYIEKWHFSIDSNNPNQAKLVNQLQKAQQNGKFIRLHYSERYGRLYWRGKTSYLVDNVEILR